MIIAIFPNTSKSQSKKIALGIVEFFNGKKVTVVSDDNEAKLIGAKPLSQVDLNKIDFIISMGGDGTIMRLAHRFAGAQIPILGINLGQLGFMADIPLDDIYPSLQDLLNGHYAIEKRVMIEGESLEGEKALAINDFVIHRARNPSLVEIAIHINGTYLNTFEADGVILATPTGSTAYSLAAGGPILTPELDSFVLTPISPHTISNRPLILPADIELQIQYLSDYDPVEVVADGHQIFKLNTGGGFRLRKSKLTFQLVNLQRRDYFSTLRTKLGWAGKLR
ncbi:MAG: NAD(+)/NADH kinase [Chlamydiia bacterium]|nr:NAD(+)/NADH kinase [Chlamydiia bacterium]MCP5491774.1 NAD(+)/NADH kinase [Chlamydiales bacterium]